LSHDIVVKQHAGSIEVDTRPGEFTEFRIILPLKLPGFGIFSEKEGQEVETLVAVPTANPCRYSQQGLAHGG
jgi:hypothetical protein